MLKILAIVPIYLEGCGNCTKVINFGGEETILHKNIDLVLVDVLRDRMICYEALTKRTRNITKINRYFPLYVTSNEMLVPMKIRKAKVVGDRAYGYINEEFISSIYNGVIRAHGGFEFQLIERESTFNKRRGLCKEIREEFHRDAYTALTYNSESSMKEKVKEIEEKLKELTQSLYEFRKSK